MDRKVLISPLALGGVDGEQTLTVNLTCDQIKNSPGVATDQPVSRQWETGYFDYYAWLYYWNSVGNWGAYGYMGMMPIQTALEVESVKLRVRDHTYDQNRIHLRSTVEVTGYAISATDGHLGHISDFIISDETWRICYVAVDTQNWWPGKSVLLPPEWITRDQVKAAPEWEVGQTITDDFEKQLYAYYDRQHPIETELKK